MSHNKKQMETNVIRTSVLYFLHIRHGLDSKYIAHGTISFKFKLFITGKTTFHQNYTRFFTFCTHYLPRSNIWNLVSVKCCAKSGKLEEGKYYWSTNAQKTLSLKQSIYFFLIPNLDSGLCAWEHVNRN